MKSYLFNIFLLLAFSLQAQTYTLPSVYFDSLTYEVQKGRVCDSLQVEQAIQIDVLKQAVHGTNKALEFRTKENEALQFIIGRWEADYKKSEEIHAIDVELLRRQKKTLWKVILGEGGVIAFLVLLLI